MVSLAFVLGSFHHAAGELVFGAEQIEQKLPMTPQHSSDLLHRFELRAHRTMSG